MTREIVQEVFKVYPSGRSVKKHLLCISFVHLYSFVPHICTHLYTRDHINPFHLPFSFIEKEDYST